MMSLIVVKLATVLLELSSMPYTEDDNWDYMGRRDRHSSFIVKALFFMIVAATLMLVSLFAYLIFLFIGFVGLAM